MIAQPSRADGATAQISAHHPAKPDYAAIPTILIFATEGHMDCSIISGSICRHFVLIKTH